jgi:hypothetical protein
MTLLLTIGALGGCVTGYLNFSNGLAYPNFPIYKVLLHNQIYVLFAGFLLNMPLCIHMIVSAIVFLYMIYSSRGFTLQQFLFDWLMKQDGFRYLILLILCCFNVFCYGYSLVALQNDVTLQIVIMIH